MSDNTTLNAPTVAGGDVIYDEDIGGGVKMPTSKIHTGAHGADGGAVTSANPFPVVASPPTSLTIGQATIAVTNTAVQLTGSSTSMRNGAIVQALAGNAGKVYVGLTGVTSSTGFELQAGQACPVGLVDLSLIYVVGAGVGDGVCFVGS